jgi:fatty-acyl-CoA synthase
VAIIERKRFGGTCVNNGCIPGFAHERWGEAPHAFVVLKEGAHADERELLEFARANLAHFKAPHSVTFVKELPKTATGKIQKYILRAQRPAIAPQ